MSKKMKGVALSSSSYGQFVDAKARFKHQTLMQDYQELHKEAEATRSKLEITKRRKLTLVAEVRLLRRRYKYLTKNKAEKTPQGQLVRLNKYENQLHKTVKETNSSRKEAKPCKVAPIADVNKKGKIFSAKESARRNPSPVIDLNQKDKKHGRKEAFLRNKIPVFDLNQSEKTHGGKQATLRMPTPTLDLNQREILYSGNETALRNSPPAFDLNQMGRTHIGRENAAQNRAPVFDLNRISGEEEEPLDNYEALRLEKLKEFLIGGGTEEQLSDLNPSVCRNVGNGPNRTGKRKISWQDQVALKV